MASGTDVWGEPVDAAPEAAPKEESAVEAVTAILMGDPDAVSRNPQAASALLYLAGLADERAAAPAERTAAKPEQAPPDPSRGKVAAWRVAVPLALFAMGIACMAVGSGILG